MSDSPARRARLRQRRAAETAAYHAACSRLLSERRNCANCRHMRIIFALGPTCELGNDGGSFQKVKPEDTCPRQEPQP